MAIGPGKYDDLCTLVRERTGGSVLVLVFQGDKGDGFACQATLDVQLALPDVLEHMAAQIRADLHAQLGRA